VVDVSRVRVRRIAHHAVVHDIGRVSDSIAPERVRVDPEVADDRVLCVRERESDRPAIVVLAGSASIVIIPRLGEVALRGLGLSEA
jgi:hypothetical protein